MVSEKDGDELKQTNYLILSRNNLLVSDIINLMIIYSDSNMCHNLYSLTSTVLMYVHHDIICTTGRMYFSISSILY